MTILNQRRTRRGNHRPTAGFTLIELMVAITISLLLLVALSAVFLNLSRSNNEMAKTNIQIENGRFAMQLLQTDIAHAGFWGAYVPQFDDFSSNDDPALADVAGGTVPNKIPDPCLAYASWTAEHKTNLLGIPLQGYDTVPDTCLDLLQDRQVGTDVLVVRHAETSQVCVPPQDSASDPKEEFNCEVNNAVGPLYFQPSMCATAAEPYVFGTDNFVAQDMNCTASKPTSKRRFISNIYYIRDHANTVGDGIPTLVRSQFDLADGTLAHQTPVALIEGIEAFRVEYGIDSLSDADPVLFPPPLNKVDYTNGINWADEANLNSPTNRGNGIADGAFIRCTTAVPCTAAQMANVVAVKLYLVSRSREATPGYTDGKTYTLGSTTWTPANTSYKRHVFSSSVRLHNISARRETP